MEQQLLVRKKLQWRAVRRACIGSKFLIAEAAREPLIEKCFNTGHSKVSSESEVCKNLDLEEKMSNKDQSSLAPVSASSWVLLK